MVQDMDASNCPDAAAPLAAFTPPDEPRSASPDGVATSAQFSPTATCPDCSGSSYVDDNATTLPCPSCDRTGTVCSWCSGSLHDEDTPLHRAGDCRSCLTTAVHRSTFASVAAYDAAYDTNTWEGLARSNADQAERALRELADMRQRLNAARETIAAQGFEIDTLRRAQHTASVAAGLQRREIDDLKRQLRLASERLTKGRAA